LYHSVLVVYFVEPLQLPLYILSRAYFVESLHLILFGRNTLQSPFLPSLSVLDTHSPLVCLSIAPLYGLRYSPASCRLPPSDIQDKPPTVQVGHYGRPTVTRGRVSTTAPATSKDTEKQCAEGRCFTCNRQGHIARDCPNKKDKPKMPNKPKAQARKVEAEVNESDADVESEADDPDSFIKRARALKEDHKLEIRRMAITADKGEEGSDQDF
jgi:hypothetical protein